MLQYLICVEAPPQLMGKGDHVWRKSYPDQGGYRCYHRLCQKITLSTFISHFLLLNTVPLVRRHALGGLDGRHAQICHGHILRSHLQSLLCRNIA